MTTLILDRRTKTLYADQKETYEKGKLAMKCRKIMPVYLANRKHWGWTALGGDSSEGYTFLHYISTLTDISQLYEMSDKRNNWKELAGFLVSKDGKQEYTISNDGVPMPITEDVVTDGAGYVPAKLLLTVGVEVPKVFQLLARHTAHTSAEFDYIEYGKKNAQIIYDQSA